jgi:hypothetical protein
LPVRETAMRTVETWSHPFFLEVEHSANRVVEYLSLI